MSLWVFGVAVVSWIGGWACRALVARWPPFQPPAEDDGGPEADRLIAEAMAAWREEAAWRIARRLEADGVTENDDLFVVVTAIMEELEEKGVVPPAGI